MSEYDVVVVGAGPAGIAAACAAAECQKRVAVVDDNVAAGGQIWRGPRHGQESAAARRWLDRAARAAVDWLPAAAIISADPRGRLDVLRHDQVAEIRFQQLVLATGARELFLPFPGWTLPGVCGAGGLQALVKSGLPIANRRVVVAGSGPLLLAVAACLAECGAHVVAVVEQAPLRRVVQFGWHVVTRDFAKFQQSLALRRALRRTIYRTGCWPRQANGQGRLESVLLTDGTRYFEHTCDYLACGFGLIPNLELPSLLGCATRGTCLQVDEFQRTSVPSVFGAGELTGIGGVEKSLVEGQIAGFAAGGAEPLARNLFTQRDRQGEFARVLARCFRLRSDLQRLPDPETLVCRCEDVALATLRDFRSQREAKLHTRCGMGACQGRVCQAAAAFLFGWQDAPSPRPPLFPTPLGGLARTNPPGDAPPADPKQGGAGK